MVDPIVLHTLLEISQEPSDPQVGTGIKVEAETWLQPAAIPTVFSCFFGQAVAMRTDGFKLRILEWPCLACDPSVVFNHRWKLLVFRPDLTLGCRNDGSFAWIPSLDTSAARGSGFQQLSIATARKERIK